MQGRKIRQVLENFSTIETTRLRVQDWWLFVNQPKERAILERELEAMLSPQITKYLPLSMQFPASYVSISDWVSDRSNEAQVFCVHLRKSRALAGLIIVAHEPDPSEIPLFHLGYFFGERYWGKGIATEAVTSFVAAIEKGPALRMVARVDPNNLASARVLKKSGFRLSQMQLETKQQAYEFTVSRN